MKPLIRPTVSGDARTTAEPPAASSAAPRDARPAYFRSLAEAVRDPDELISLLGLPDDLREPARRAAKSFPLLVPRSFLARMRPGDPADPLLRQVLPLGAEEETAPGFTADAVGDLDARKAPGLIHKYRGRALLIAAGACAVHCRYCFRRHYPYQDDPRRLDDREPALAAIAEDGSITEVILSGGDPLMLTDARLAALVSRLDAIGHLRRLRLHTRLPIVLPDRVTPELLALLTSTRLATAVVVHANHPNELAGDCAEALLALAAAHGSSRSLSVLLSPWGEGPGVRGVMAAPSSEGEPRASARGSGKRRDGCEARPNVEGNPSPLPRLPRERGTEGAPRLVVLNQAVLLRGVNDDADVLAELSERLFDLGVLPYYLHQLDRVAGAAHFEVPEAVGRALVDELRRRLPGYLVPKYVRETPGEPGKTPIGFVADDTP
ncbi:MAG TPA: KamA family radical SAM protein [Planctomycetaceae bacterium]